MKDLSERTALLAYLYDHGVYAVFHYVPLHSAEAGRRFSRFHGVDQFTTSESERLIRLPVWYGMDDVSVEKVIAGVRGYFDDAK